jgi:phosphopantetheinyl transferase
LGRILLRRVLARYLGEDPADLDFQYNANGKPELANPFALNISFSLSNSGSEIVLAVTSALAIGVDLETVDRAGAALRISQMFFSASEIQHLESVGTKASVHALILWSLKESIVKANGETVWDGLARLPLAIEGHRIYWPSAQHTGSPHWQLVAGGFGQNCVLAFAVKSLGDQTGRPLVFRTYRFGAGTEDHNGFVPEFSTHT